MAEVLIDENPIANNPEIAGVMCGYPKTGRTWMRYMLATALSEEYDLGVDVDMTNFYTIVPNDIAGQAPGQPLFAHTGRAPQVEMSHLAYDPEQYADKQILFQTRDPRDVLVSHWMHNRKQLQQYDGDLGDFVHDKRFGIGAFIAHLTSWAPYLDRPDIITYEEMRSDPTLALERVTERFRLGLGETAIAKAVQEGSMDRMGAKEVARGIAGQNYDRQDRDARRVRRGKVGGFVDHMTEADQQYIHEVVSGASNGTQKIIAMTGYNSPATR